MTYKYLQTLNYNPTKEGRWFSYLARLIRWFPKNVCDPCNDYLDSVNRNENRFSGFTHSCSASIIKHVQWKIFRKKTFGKLAKSPLLAFYEFRKSLAIETGASKTGLGTSVMQFDDKKLDRVACPETSEAEVNCSITKRETMAVIWSMRHCRELI